MVDFLHPVVATALLPIQPIPHMVQAMDAYGRIPVCFCILKHLLRFFSLFRMAAAFQPSLQIGLEKSDGGGGWVGLALGWGERFESAIRVVIALGKYLLPLLKFSYVLPDRLLEIVLLYRYVVIGSSMFLYRGWWLASKDYAYNRQVRINLFDSKS